MTTHARDTFDSFAEPHLLITTLGGRAFRIDPADVPEVSLWKRLDQLRIDCAISASSDVVIHRVGVGDWIPAIEV